MISVIISTLNQEKTIAEVVGLAFRSPKVSEVIVVDDNSFDNTLFEARKAGAVVLRNTQPGKGASMREGIHHSKNSILVFLESNITTYPKNIVQLLTEPILKGKAEFCKAFHSRKAGRVTELVAKPLLSILYPDFPIFLQPLNGVISGKRELFEAIKLEDGYGVDVGILMDMYKMKVKIAEVFIGHIESEIISLEELIKMSNEVASVILNKSTREGKNNFELLEQMQVIQEHMELAICENSLYYRQITRNISVG